MSAGETENLAVSNYLAGLAEKSMAISKTAWATKRVMKASEKGEMRKNETFASAKGGSDSAVFSSGRQRVPRQHFDAEAGA